MSDSGSSSSTDEGLPDLIESVERLELRSRLDKYLNGASELTRAEDAYLADNSSDSGNTELKDSGEWIHDDSLSMDCSVSHKANTKVTVQNSSETCTNFGNSLIQIITTPPKCDSDFSPPCLDDKNVEVIELKSDDSTPKRKRVYNLDVPICSPNNLEEDLIPPLKKLSPNKTEYELEDSGVVSPQRTEMSPNNSTSPLYNFSPSPEARPRLNISGPKILTFSPNFKTKASPKKISPRTKFSNTKNRILSKLLSSKVKHTPLPISLDDSSKMEQDFPFLEPKIEKSKSMPIGEGSATSNDALTTSIWFFPVQDFQNEGMCISSQLIRERINNLNDTVRSSDEYAEYLIEEFFDILTDLGKLDKLLGADALGEMLNIPFEHTGEINPHYATVSLYNALSRRLSNLKQWSQQMSIWCSNGNFDLSLIKDTLESAFEAEKQLLTSTTRPNFAGVFVSDVEVHSLTLLRFFLALCECIKNRYSQYGAAPQSECGKSQIKFSAETECN